MTATVIEFEPFHELRTLRGLVREAAALGARFRIGGAGIYIDQLDELPGTLQQDLRHYAERGLLYAYFDGEELDLPALELADRLGIVSVLVETRAECRAAVRTLLKDIRVAGPLGCDIETAPKPGVSERPWIRLNTDGTLAAVQPVTHDRTGLDPYRSNICTLQLFGGGERCFVFRGKALIMVLQSHWLRRRHLVIHNAGFELKFFMQHCADYRPPPHRRQRFRYECTSQGTGLLAGVGFGGEGRSLATAAKTFLNLDVPKELQTSDWSAVQLSLGQLAYASSDAIIARRLWPLMEQQLQQKKRWNAYELQRRAIPAVAGMELRGVHLDRAAHKSQTEAWAHELAEARQQYVEITGNPPPTTPNEVRAWLENVLPPPELARWMRTEKSGALSIKEKALKQLGHIESAWPVLRILAKEKLLSTFGPKLADKISPVTGRLHPSFNLAATKAGRSSASNPNVQQLPTDKRAAGFRACIAAAPGCVIVGCDFNQVELRALAWLSRNAALTRVYADGKDLHRETAAKIARIPVDEVTDTQRSGAKAVNFGSIFGMRGRGLASYAFDTYGVEMTVREADDYLYKFFAGYPGLKEHLDRHADLCQRRGYVAIGAGRVVEAHWERFGLSYQQCCNLPVQGIAADAMLRAITMTHARLRQARIRGGLVASVHDELLIEVHEDDAGPARALLEETMIEAFALTFPGAPTNGVATATIGRSWAEVKDPPKASENTRGAATA
jgi:DNA polymerase I